MSTHSSHTTGGFDPAVGNHEATDAAFGPIAKSAIGLSVVIVFSYLVVWLVFGMLSRHEDTLSATRMYPLAVGHENRLPPEPRLQTNPKQDLRDLRAAEAETLNGYHWVDRNAGIVRIPIDAAMKLTLERGLPARAATAAQGAGK
jgi:hypothetical protein